jgi:hypothetical protein
MKSLTVWEYSEKTEAERLLHCAHQIIVGFFKSNNFIVLPYNPNVFNANIVTFPFLPYFKIPRFWEEAKKADIITLPIRCNKKAVEDTEKLLTGTHLPKPNFINTQKLWQKARKKC